MATTFGHYTARCQRSFVPAPDLLLAGFDRGGAMRIVDEAHPQSLGSREFFGQWPRLPEHLTINAYSR